jgi:putative tryptophan/tyrosine transport system permease protein
MELWIGALNLGFLYAFMAMGVFITSRIHDFPDITVDGSFVTGAAVTAVLAVAGVHPFTALAASFFAGIGAGAITAIIHTRFSINGLLAGIIVMTGLYSVNLHIMGKANIPLLDYPGLMGYAARLNPGLPSELWLCLLFFLLMVLFWLGVSLFFRTDFGITMRATGNNASMAGATGVNVNAIKTIGIALANGLVAVSGSLVAQYQGFADAGMGAGTIVFGLAAVIVGESLIRTRSLYGMVAGVIIGSVVFRLMVAAALYAGLNPVDLKLITALFVLIILIGPKVIAGPGLPSPVREGLSRLISSKRRFAGLTGTALAAVGFTVYLISGHGPGLVSQKVIIGVLQFNESTILNTTRDSFLKEMQRLGYDARKAVLKVENAHGDMPTINSILDKFLLEKVDMVVTISSSCTQAALKKVKDRPIVFATVANPFVLGVGKSDTDHIPNVTGVYGFSPMDRLLGLVSTLISGPKRIGCLWDPSQVNSVYNMERLKNAIEQNKNMTFVGTTVSGTAEVYQAAASLVAKSIDIFALSTDLVVFEAFDSVVKAARSRKVPIVVSDPELLSRGALAACGFDYTSSGIQAAHLADRILKGEKPAAIPLEQYKKLTVGVNLKVARELGVTVPQELRTQANLIIGNGPDETRY